MDAILEMFQNIFERVGLNVVADIFAQIRETLAKLFGGADEGEV